VVRRIWDACSICLPPGWRGDASRSRPAKTRIGRNFRHTEEYELSNRRVKIDMGKRKLDDTHSFFVCDHTGVPLKRATCYIPVISPAGKLTKRGNFCNWESAMAALLQYKEWPDKDASGGVTRGVQHIQKLLGGIIPDYTLADITKLDHLGGTLSQIEWHEHCCNTTRSLQAVRIDALTGAKVAVLLPPGDEPGRLNTSTVFGVTLGLETREMPPSGKLTNRKIVVYWDRDARFDESKSYNTTVNDIFGCDYIYGDVVVSHVVYEECVFPRVRCTDILIEECISNKPAKKKKTRGLKNEPPPNVNTQTVEEFNEERARMAHEFKAFEARGSKDAHCPREVANCSVMPPPSGKELAQIAFFRGLPHPDGDASERAAKALEKAPRAPA